MNLQDLTHFLISRRPYLAFAISILIFTLCVFQWYLLAEHSTIISDYPLWYWPYSSKSAGSGFVILILLSLLSLIIIIFLRRFRNYRRAVCLLFLAAVGLQYSFAAQEGAGKVTLRNRAIKFRHASFLNHAIDHPNTIAVLRNYEAILDQNKFTYFAKSKPPGMFLFYSLNADVSKLIWYSEKKTAQLENLRDFAFWVWPAMSFLFLFPLYSLVRLIYDEEIALLTCILVSLMPSVQLMPLVTDQVLFPLLGVAMVYATTIQYGSKFYWLSGILVGALCYLSLYFTFALIAIGPLIVAFVWKLHRRNAYHFKRLLIYTISVLIGFVCLLVLFYYFLNYDPVIRYEKAVINHIASKGWKPGLILNWGYGKLNILEFAFWMGAPLFIGMIAGFFAENPLKIFKDKAGGVVQMALLSVLILLAFFSKTLSEVARLWIFLLPFVATVVAYFLSTRFLFCKRHIAIIIVLQFCTIYIFKIYMDYV